MRISTPPPMISGRSGDAPTSDSERITGRKLTNSPLRSPSRATGSGRAPARGHPVAARPPPPAPPPPGSASAARLGPPPPPVPPRRAPGGRGAGAGEDVAGIPETPRDSPQRLQREDLTSQLLSLG